ncbi:hypothetical protein [Shewanella oncorhynchi]|uniref:hypothetical protein n=1 Tax=Shewanella oncorhynchi TaxID=2726434 RepID=UPI003D7B02FA
MTRLLLIGLLTVLSFSSFATSPIDEITAPDHVPPKVTGTPLFSCNFKRAPFWSDFSQCKKLNEDKIRGLSPSVHFDSVNCTLSGEIVNCFSVYSGTRADGSTYSGTINNPNYGTWRFQYNADVQECPPDDQPLYKIGPNPINPSDPNSPKACFPVFKPCPLGFFKNEVTLSNGESKCVPITCPDKGTRVNNVFNKNGAIGVGSAGTYCDGKCSYTIQPTDAPYNGSSFVFGTSNGAVCGQGDDKNIKFTPTDKEGTCTTTQLSTGANFQTCTEGDGTAPEEDNAEGELDDKAQDASVDPLTKPSKYQGADCSITADQLYCIGTEIIEALDHQTAETKKQQDEKHNKLVELQKDISEYVENQQRDRATKQSSQSQTETSLILGGLSEITTAVKASSGNGGGTGGDSDSYIEQFDGDSILAKFSSDLDGMSQRIKDANDGLDSKLDEGNSKFGESDPLWNPFKDIPTYLPAEYVCQPFTLGTDEHPMILDLCEYEELIKAVIGFVFIMLTALRLFYQAQIIVRNSAIGSA